jgi:DNA-binding winged helix-turn-helix (wHTH) protein
MRKRFGDFLFDSETRQLLREGRAVHLSPKAYGLLELLLSRMPKAVSKDEIQAAVWGQTFLSESTLTNVVTELRAAIGDRARRSELLRTVHGFGYAFCGDVIDDRGDELPAMPRFRLVRGKRSFPLVEGENVLGRDPDVNVCIDHASVSRRHARILIGEEKATLEDLGSRNGTFLGGRRLASIAHVQDGDVIGLGPVTVVFERLAASGTTESDLSEA